MQRVRELRDVLRFSAVFTALILAPVILLASLSLRSLETEAVALDADLQRRAERIATEVHAQLDATFVRFVDRLRRDLPYGTVQPDALDVPGLRAAFRFEPGGALTGSLRLDDRPTQVPSAAWSRAYREARRAEQAGSLAPALRAWARADAVAATPEERATSALGAARSRLHLGRDVSAEEALVRIADTYLDVRDPQRFRVADLATLLRAEAASMRSDTETSTALRRGLVERALAGVWTVGAAEDGALAWLALDRLDGQVSPRWHATARERLTQRMDEAWWADRVQDELRLMPGRPVPEGEFLPYSEEKALWVLHTRGDVLWAFSFDTDAIRRDLSARVLGVVDRIDPDLIAELLPVTDTTPRTTEALARRVLAPELPRDVVIVRAADPEAFTARRARARSQRALVIGLAVLASVLGLLASVRLVNREIETARTKADFAANVSHELRSPITQIRLKAEALHLGLTRGVSDEREHYAAIVRQAEHLSRLVDNVLDFSAIERGVKRYTFRPEPLDGVLLKALQSQDDAARDAGLRLTLDMPDVTPTLHMDREAMGQVFTNLLSNAIKYGSDGETVDVVAAWVGYDTVDIAVTDHGIGIAPEDQTKVFDHFFRVSSTDVRRRRGTGIGLTIVRYIVEAHGGTITVDSRLGQGSTFRVTLPLHPPDDLGG